MSIEDKEKMPADKRRNRFSRRGNNSDMGALVLYLVLIYTLIKAITMFLWDDFYR
jgi:hypothetical protein